MEDLIFEQEWESPQEFEGSPLLEWPKNVLPELAEQYIAELSRSTETPIELATMLFFALVATAVQKKYEIEVKKSYREPLNIWILAILPPAARKTAVFAEIFFSIRKWEEEQRIKLEPLVNSQISKQKTVEEKIKHYRELAAKSKRDKEFENYTKQIQ